MDKVYSIETAAGYIMRRVFSGKKPDLIAARLHKLLYCVQAWSLGMDGCRIIDCEFEAWVHGPVCRCLYDKHKAAGYDMYSFLKESDIPADDFESVATGIDKRHFDYILYNFADSSDAELEIMIHNEDPWINARGDINPLDACTNVITDDSMRKYYGERWKFHITRGGTCNEQAES